jgi:2-aminoadipate transaminase
VDAFAPYQPRFIEAATSTGCSTDAIEEALTREPGTVKVVYVIPNFHNPTGRTMGERERARLADLADRHNIVLVEDDAYGELRYDGGHQPSVASFSSSGRVLSLGTFSKILAPGLRLGWIIAKGETRAKLLAAKQAADFYTSMVPQIVAHDAARDGFLEHHIDVLRQAYGARRDRLVRRLTERLSVPHRWITPSGGFFLWLEVPGLDGAAIFEAAAASRLVVIPGHMFGSTAASREAVRLSFSATPPAVIDEGTARLVEVVCEVAGRPLTDAAPRSSRH